MNGLNALARMLGIKPDHAEDALHSERAARAVLTRRQALALAAAAPVAAVLPAAARAPLMLSLDPGGVGCVAAWSWATYVEHERAYWAGVNAQASRDMKLHLIAMVRERDRLQSTTRTPVQLSTPYPPQENQDKDSA